MNDDNLKQLVNLLSYLKKHDDVESELVKKKDPPPGHAAGRRKHVAITDPTQRTLLERLGSTQLEGLTDPAVLQARKDARTSVGSGTPGSDPEETSETPEIPEETGGSSERDYSEGPTFHTGERGADYALPGEREVGGKRVKVVSPSEESSGPSMVEDPLTGVSRRNYNELPDDAESSGGLDWLIENETLDWLKDEGINSLAELRDRLNPKTKGPGDYSRPAEQIRKSSESVLLSLLQQLGI